MSVAEINALQWPAEQVAFMEDFYAQTEAIPGSKRRLWNGVVDLEFTHAKLGVVLDIIDSREPGKKNFKQAMKWMQGLADKHNVRFFADAEPFDSDHHDEYISPYDLKQAYLRNGWHNNGGSSVVYPAFV